MCQRIIVWFGEKLLYIKRIGIYQVAINYARSGEVVRKAAYGSEGTIAGMGGHSLLLCVGVFGLGLYIYR